MVEMKIGDVILNPNNPRLIKDDKFKKLVKSIKEFPEMLNIRPIVVNQDMIILGGNMRYKACLEAGLKTIPVIITDLPEDKQKEFLIKDNVSGGEWDWDILANEWDALDLDKWGLDLPMMTETEKLSKLTLESIYYEPTKIPNINLADCINKEKFNAKIDFINGLELDDESKEMLKLFAYRFLKIDFENVANYYHFNASEVEKSAIERLRLVLVDDGIDGFIEDDMIRIYKSIEGWEN